MKQNFTKADLKDGMVVEQRNGWRGMVFGNRVLSGHGYNRLDNYSNTLEWGERYYDICRVYAPIEYGCGIQKYVDFIAEGKDDEFELIWERKEKKEIKLTTEERAFLNSILLVSDYKYIARDKINDSLYVYKHKPNRGLFIARWMTIEAYKEELKEITEQTKGMFKFITWDDDEPYLIEDLLKL
jgi:hypothetical protein